MLATIFIDFIVDICAFYLGVECILDEDGKFHHSSDVKEMLFELQSECTNCKSTSINHALFSDPKNTTRNAARQVTDLLRDRLQATGAELIDARARVADLERTQAADRDALTRSNLSLAQTCSYLPHLAIPPTFMDAYNSARGP